MQKYIAIQYFTPLAVRKNIVPQKHSEPKMSKQKIGIGKLSEQMFGISNIYLENAEEQYIKVVISFGNKYYHLSFPHSFTSQVTIGILNLKIFFAR